MYHNTELSIIQQINCGFIFGTLFGFEQSGNPPDFKSTELITQELVDALELEYIQTNIDDRNIEEETRMELRAAIEVIRDSHNSRCFGRAGAQQ